MPAGVALFGDFSGVAIASWGALEFGIAKATAGSVLFKTGLVGVRCLWTIDVLVLRPASFSKITSIT